MASTWHDHSAFVYLAHQVPEAIVGQSCIAPTRPPHSYVDLKTWRSSSGYASNQETSLPGCGGTWLNSAINRGGNSCAVEARESVDPVPAAEKVSG
jgi:hypothetical protein